MSTPLYNDGSNSPIADISWAGFKLLNLGNVSWQADGVSSLGSPDGGDTLLRPLSFYLAKNLFLNNTSMVDNGTTFALSPANGPSYTWDMFNHVTLPGNSSWMVSDNDPATSYGKNQISAGTHTSYTWGRPYAVHSGSRMTVGANSGSTSQPGAAMAVQASSDATIGTSSVSATTTIVGVGTYFTRDVGVGDYIQLQGLSTVGKVLSITTDTSLTVDTALGDGTSRNIILSMDVFTASDNSGNKHLQVKKDGLVTIGDRQVLQSNYNVLLSAVQTTNNTPTILSSIAIQPYSNYLVEILVNSSSSDQSTKSAFKRTVAVYRSSSSAPVIQGQTFYDFTQTPDSSLAVEFAISGNDLNVTVTGDSSSTINWASTVRYQEFIDGAI